MLTKYDTDFLLSESNRTKIAEELLALETKPINGWDTIYPTLFAFLRDNVSELVTQANMHKTPGIVIRFEKPNTWQMSAQLMTDSSTQIHFGAEYLRNFIINPSQQDIATSYDQFRWVIAHELGHLSDPLYVLYGKSFKIRTLFNRMLLVLFYLGLLGLCWNRMASFLFYHPLCFIGTSLALDITQRAFTILLFRKFEYNADKKSLSIFPPARPQLIEEALTKMQNPIIAFSYNPNPENPRTVLEKLFPAITHYSWYKKYLVMRYFYLHPYYKKRVNRIKKIKALSL